MVDKAVIERLVKAASLTSNDRVLDIGGGPGGLTDALASLSGYVFSVEKDSAYASELRERFASSKKIKVVEGDILEVELPKFDKIVSNPPYGILQPFFLRLLREKRHEFSSCTIIVPQGFSRLAMAKPGAHGFGVMSAFFYAFYDVEVISEVKRGAFSPEPRVRSLILRISPKEDATPLSEMLRLMFLEERRKISNSIANVLWNHGETILGRKMTKKESRTMVLDIETHSRMGNMPEKQILQLSNAEMAMLASSMLALVQHNVENL